MHKRKNLFRFLLVLLVFFSVGVGSVMGATLEVVPFDLNGLGTATAQWTTAAFNSGSYSVNLKTINNFDYSYTAFDPFPATIDDITSLSFYYNHVSDNIWSGPRFGILINDSGTYRIAVSGAADKNTTDWNKANGITGDNIVSYGTNPDDVWWYGSCNDATCSIYTQTGGPVNFAAVQTALDGNIEGLLVYMGIVDGINVGTGEAYVDDIEVNGLTYYGKIQDAIDAASPGDIINIADGTYDGFNADKIGMTIKAASTPIINGTGISIAGQLVGILVSAHNVTIEGLTINGSYSTGIFVYNAIAPPHGTVLKNNVVDQTWYDPGALASWDGHAIYAESGSSPPTIIRDSIIEYGSSSRPHSGIHVRGDHDPDYNISNNTIKITQAPKYQIGILVRTGEGSAIVIDNIITSPNKALGSWTKVFGIWLFGGNPDKAKNIYAKGNKVNKTDYALWVTGPNTDNISIKYNDFSNNDFGAVIEGNAAGVNLNFNNISNNTAKGVHNGGTVLVNATFNYWGSLDGPGGIGPGTGDDVSANVAYSPWLGMPVGAVPMTYGMDATSAIQEAINNANDGDTIYVSAGNYNENLNINKSLKIIGAGAATTTLTGAHTITADDVTITGFTIVPTSPAITIDSSASAVDNINISNNIFNLTASPAVGIHICNAEPNNKISNVYMDYNTFNGPADKICNPWKIGGDFTSTISCEIDNIDFQHNIVDKCSIPINLHNKSIKDILIDDNTFTNTDGVVYVWEDAGETPTGILSKFVFTNNDVDATNTYGVGIDTAVPPVFRNANFGTGNRINNNTFVGINGNYGFEAVSILSNLTSYTLNAENNWWGDCTGPGGAGSGLGSNVSTNVDYTPWLGICIANKTNVTCAFETDNITLSANVSSSLNINSVLISYTINGTNFNETATKTSGDIYSAVIPSTQLAGGQNVTWNVFANDILGNNFSNGLKTFYVRNRTSLIVNPLAPDGLSNWYVREPLFTLIKDGSEGDVYYRWDSVASILYTGPFGLENMPNPPVETAGTLELNWWTDFSACGNESEQTEVFYVDLKNPDINDLNPANNSIVYNNLRPNISAYLDEVYQSNSGINQSTILMEVDGNPVTPNITQADTLDAIIWNISDLSLGKHNATVNITDIAGRNSELTWFFELAETPPFNMSVNSPIDGIYGSKKVPFNITLFNASLDPIVVDLLEYINYNDTKPKWKKLCSDCSEYGNKTQKTKTLNEGNNNLTIRATDSFGTVKEENVSLFVDSKIPKILKTEPKRNSVTNGTGFYIKYTEDNLKEVSVSWNLTIPLASCTESGINKECYVDLNLTAYNGTEIEYYFNVSDDVRSVISKKITVLVDTTKPVLDVSLPEDGSIGLDRRVQFNISVSEDVTLEYSDNSAPFRRLCSKCDEYGNFTKKTKTFTTGNHTLIIKATDKAGQTDIKEVSFEVV